MRQFWLFLFPRATSQADMLACPFGDCREGQIPRHLGRCKIDAPLLAAGSLTSCAYFGSLKELFNDTILLNTGCSGVESCASIQKYPFLTNWKLSYAFAPSKLGST